MGVGSEQKTKKLTVGRWSQLLARRCKNYRIVGGDANNGRKEVEKDINVGVVLNTIENTAKEDWWAQKNKERREAVKWHWNQ